MLFWTKRFTLYSWYWTQQHCYKKQNFEELSKMPRIKISSKTFVFLCVLGG